MPVIVRDTTAPVLSGVSSDLTLEATGPTGAVAMWTTPTATDVVDGPVAVLCAPASGTTFAIGPTLVTCSATDAHLNVSEATFERPRHRYDAARGERRAVHDHRRSDGANGAVATWAPLTATDLVDGLVTVVCVPASGSVFAVGSTTVRCTSHRCARQPRRGLLRRRGDGYDTAEPERRCRRRSRRKRRARRARWCSGPRRRPSISVDPAVPVTCVPASGSPFALGETLVTCSATDAHGNRAESVFAVRVVDTTGPALVLPASAGAEATSPLGAVVTYTASAVDLVTGAAPVVCAPASGGV